MSEEQADANTGGFRFVVTLLASLGTILYAVYVYLQNTPVDALLHKLLCGFMATALILVFYLLFYLLIKGYLMELQSDSEGKQDNSKLKERLTKIASQVYLISFFVFTVLLASTVYVLILKYFLTLGFICFWFLLLIGIFLILCFCIYLFFGWSGWHRLKIPSTLFVGILVSVIFLGFLYPLVAYSTITGGRVIIDMNSVYYKNDAPIPVWVHVTGLNTNLSIQLLQESFNHNLSEIDNITLSPERNTNKVTQGENSTLFGNTLNFGSYNVFIDTSGLSAGYYELVAKRQKYKKTYDARGFYLSNENVPSVTEELNTS